MTLLTDMIPLLLLVAFAELTSFYCNKRQLVRSIKRPWEMLYDRKNIWFAYWKTTVGKNAYFCQGYLAQDVDSHKDYYEYGKGNFL